MCDNEVVIMNILNAILTETKGKSTKEIIYKAFSVGRRFQKDLDISLMEQFLNDMRHNDMKHDVEKT